MATRIDGIGGFNKTDGTTKLFAAYGNDIVDVQSGLGYGQNLFSGNKAEFRTFLDNEFFENYKNQPKHFDGTSWVKSLANKMPMAKYMYPWKTQLYLGYCKFPQTGVEAWDKDPIGSTISAADITFPSRVFFPDTPLDRKTLKWGTLWSQKFTTRFDGDNKLFLSSVGDVGFIEAGIKFGDPLFILSGNSRSIGQYTVSQVNSNTQVTLLEPVPVTITNVSGWCGSNWFDVTTSDGDYLTWLGESNDRLLCFKQESLHRYDGTSVRQIKGVPGTTSGRSVQNLKDTLTMYFNGSSRDKTGFYITDGNTAKKQSNPVDYWCRAIAGSNYTEVVSWTEGNLYRAWAGDLTNSNYDIALSKVIFTYDASTDTWSIDPNPKTIVAATQLRESGLLNTYIADTDASVFKTGDESVYAYDQSPIPFAVETRIMYPEGSETFLTFTRCQVVARNARGVKVQYKLIDTPNDNDDNWMDLGDITSDKTEFSFPSNHAGASGIKYRFAQIGTREPDLLIEKISTFYRPEGIFSANLSG